jgi:hypothetical protein
MVVTATHQAVTVVLLAETVMQELAETVEALATV